MTITERVRSIPEAEKRLEDICAEMVRVTHSKAFTGAELTKKMDELEAEYGAVEDGLKSYKRSLQFRAGSEIGAPHEPPPEGTLVSCRQGTSVPSGGGWCGAPISEAPLNCRLRL